VRPGFTVTEPLLRIPLDLLLENNSAMDHGGLEIFLASSCYRTGIRSRKVQAVWTAGLDAEFTFGQHPTIAEFTFEALGVPWFNKDGR